MKLRTKFYIYGLRDGTPICLGYFAVSFAFGIQAENIGLTALQTFLLSATNLTSAGQFAGLDVIKAGSGLLAMALTQLVINLRYALMSSALSQKLSATMPFAHRLGIAFGVTDEIFGVSIGRRGYLSPFYSYGMITVALAGWSFGSLCGAIAGQILPSSLSDALAMALYAMFVAIVIPAAKIDRRILGVSISAATLSLIATFCPVINTLSSGMRIVWVTLLVAGIAALLFPMPPSLKERS